MLWTYFTILMQVHSAPMSTSAIFKLCIYVIDIAQV